MFTTATYVILTYGQPKITVNYINTKIIENNILKGNFQVN